MHFSTKAIHVGQEPDKETGAVVPPIYLTSTYQQDAPAELKAGYDYTRAGNPNFTNVERTLAALEDGAHATVFSSGLGAVTALASTLKAGDTVVAVDDLYGGTYRLFKQVFEKFGVTFTLADFNDLVSVEVTLARARPTWVFIETPTNPLLKIVDIALVAELAHKHGARTVVDNTFATPYFQNPLALGADVVLHSATKYLGGHSDMISGVLVTNDAQVKSQFDFARKALGLNPGPFDCWLLSRSLKTLAVRMERHQQNAMAIAELLAVSPGVKRVYYPGLSSHPGHEIAKRQMRGFGGVVSAEFNLAAEQVKRLISSFSLFTLAESLGGVESLVDHPAAMTHASIPREAREKTGVCDGLVRFSVGIEDMEDILDDIKDALAAIAA